MKSVGKKSEKEKETKIWRGGKYLLFYLRRDARVTQISRFTLTRKGKLEFSPYKIFVYARLTLLFIFNSLIYLLLLINPLTLD
jgi:hypothetical protein